jgi:hypothetical protein
MGRWKGTVLVCQSWSRLAVVAPVESDQTIGEWKGRAATEALG